MWDPEVGLVASSGNGSFIKTIYTVIKEELERCRLGSAKSAESYDEVAGIVFSDPRWEPEKLAEWCELYSKSLECLKEIQRCDARLLYRGLICSLERISMRGNSWWVKEGPPEVLVHGEYWDAHEYLKWHEDMHDEAIIERLIEEREREMENEVDFWD